MYLTDAYLAAKTWLTANKGPAITLFVVGLVIGALLS